MNAPTLLRGTTEAASHIIGGPGFAEIEAPPVLDAVWNDIVEGMRRLVGDSKAHGYCLSQVSGVDEVGWDRDIGLYERKDREHKWFFHYEVKAKVALPAAIPGYELFFKALGQCSEEAVRIATAVAAACDRVLGANNAPLSEQIARGFVMTRVLLYKPIPALVQDASDHFDRSGLTIHWCTTNPGLVVYDTDRRRYRVAECETSRVAVFPGKKFPGFYQDANLIRGLHGVADARRDTAEFNEHAAPRVSLVSFVHPTLTPDMVRWIRGHAHVFKAIESRVG
jgi:hypothetical protein